MPYLYKRFTTYCSYAQATNEKLDNSPAGLQQLLIMSCYVVVQRSASVAYFVIFFLCLDLGTSIISLFCYYCLLLDAWCCACAEVTRVLLKDKRGGGTTEALSSAMQLCRKSNS